MPVKLSKTLSMSRHAFRCAIHDVVKYSQVVVQSIISFSQLPRREVIFDAFRTIVRFDIVLAQTLTDDFEFGRRRLKILRLRFNTWQRLFSDARKR